MPHFTRNLIICIAVLGLSFLAMYPPHEKLHLGKDLAGGVSLVYQVDLKPEDPANVIPNVIETLKDRLNPGGLYEMSFTQQGRDRIEITMPLSTDAKETRKSYDAALDKLKAFEIDVDALERDLRLPPQQRDAALTAMADTPQRKAMLQPLIDAARKLDAVQAAYNKAKSENAPEDQLVKLAGEGGEALEALDAARAALLGSAVREDEVRLAMELPNISNDVPETSDTRAGSQRRMVTIDSARERALKSIRARLKDVPGSQEVIDEIVKAQADFQSKKRGYDDPADLERLVQGSGVLEFRIAFAPGESPDEQRLRRELRERGPEGVESKNSVWRQINKLENWYNSKVEYDAMIADPASYFIHRGLVGEEREGKFYVLLHDDPNNRITRAEGNWRLSRAFQSTDDYGRKAVGFAMDPAGARLMGNLTESHKGQKMAVVLDDQVVTAPNINSRIGSRGIIEGVFSDAELDYMIKTMSAGALQAKLNPKPISKDVQAPDLGKDNLDKGLNACMYSFLVVGVFMVLYYFIPGGVAVFGMICTGVMLLGAMALNRAAFSLPGIAGVALTFGMAVDSNVLIYERLREELLRGHDIRTALRLAYQRALATIVDSNVTHLITCVVLAYTATKEIKGFAITLGIGVAATMFMSLVITRVVLVFFADYIRLPGLNKQLPLVFPWIQRMMTPHVDWLGLRWPFFIGSGVLVLLSIGAVASQGENILGLEFRGGTAISFILKEHPGPDGKPAPMKMTRHEVADRVHAIGLAADKANDAVLRPLINAEVVPINPDLDGVTSDRFTIKTSITDEAKLREAVVGGFTDIVESRRALTFKGSDIEKVSDGAPVHQVLDNSLGADIGRPDVKNNVAEFVGGAAIVMANFNEPLPTKAELLQRHEYLRNQADYSARALKRSYDLVVIDGADDAVKTAVLLVRDPAVSIYDENAWREQLAQSEWKMARAAFTQSTLLASVQSFSGVIAKTFRYQAIVATFASFLLIMIYVWMRFGTFRHSMAAIIPLFHDVAIALGFIAISGWLYDTFTWTHALGIRPFRIDLGLIAAIMTIIGYSINDTIIMLDRVRENQGKLAYPTRQIINESINQTMSRTFITSGTVLFSLITLMIFGGEGVASFAYAMTVGVVVGTYSSFAIAAPFIWVRHPPAPASLRGVRAEGGTALATV